MNDWPLWRNALIPLIVVAGLVFLLVQTAGGDDEPAAQKYTFSRVLNQVRSTPEAVQSVIFRPATQEVEVRYQDGSETTVAYPVDESAFALQQLLEQKRILFDARRTGSSDRWDILTSLLPFVLLFGFWIFLMRRVRGQTPKGA